MDLILFSLSHQRASQYLALSWVVLNIITHIASAFKHRDELSEHFESIGDSMALDLLSFTNTLFWCIFSSVGGSLFFKQKLQQKVEDKNEYTDTLKLA